MAAMFTMVKACEMYPKPQLCRDPALKDDAEVVVPFAEIPGEAVAYLGETGDGDGVIALSNYRLHFSRSSSQSLQQQPQPPGPGPLSINIPLTCIEAGEVRDLFFVQILCKDGRFYLVQFADSLSCKEWAYRITNAVAPPTSVEQVSAVSDLCLKLATFV